MTTPEKKKPGRKPLPKSIKRVHLTCTVAPGTLAEFERIARTIPGGNIGRVLDMLAEAGE